MIRLTAPFAVESEFYCGAGKGRPFSAVALLSIPHFYLQPMDGPDVEANTQLALAYCLSHPQWRLSMQTHKLLGIR